MERSTKHHAALRSRVPAVTAGRQLTVARALDRNRRLVHTATLCHGPERRSLLPSRLPTLRERFGDLCCARNYVALTARWIRDCVWMLAARFVAIE